MGRSGTLLKGTTNPLAGKNWLINGDMRISQRGTSFSAVANSTYTLDRFVYNKTGAMVHTITQDTDAPTGFINSLRLNLTTPDTSIATGDVAVITQAVEGYNWARFRNSKFTLSFWIKAVTPGTYCVAFRNEGQDRSYVAEYTVDVANTWEFKTVTCDAIAPTAGTWNTANGYGLGVTWTLAAGTTYQTTPGVWQTGNFVATSNQVNGVNTGSTDFRITGAMLNIGESVAPFSRFSGGGWAEELLSCKRYYTKSYEYAVVPGTASATTGAFSGASDNAASLPHFSTYQFDVEMRAIPSLDAYNPNTGGTSTPVHTGGGDHNLSVYNVSSKGINAHSATAISAGTTWYVHFVAKAEL